MLWFFRGEALVGSALVGVGALAGLRTPDRRVVPSFDNGNRNEDETVITSADQMGTPADTGTDELQGTTIRPGLADRTGRAVPTGSNPATAPGRTRIHRPTPTPELGSNGTAKRLARLQLRMRTVSDADGTRYLLVKRSRESSLVRNPETGTERYLPNEELDAVDGASPLDVAAAGIPEPVRRVVTAAHTQRALGLLVELTDRGPVAIRDLLAAYDLCESDLHGLLAEFRAAGLVREADVGGERGYDATETTRAAVATLRP
jgi:hypothetical protein